MNFCGNPDRGFQKDFIFIFAPRSCEKPQCIFIFWENHYFLYYVYWQEVKEKTLLYITYYSTYYFVFNFFFLHVPQIFNSCGINFGNEFNMLGP